MEAAHCKLQNLKGRLVPSSFATEMIAVATAAI